MLGSRSLAARITGGGKESDAAGRRQSAGCFLALLLALLGPRLALSADVDHCRKLLITGKYGDCVDYARKAIDDHAYGEHWYALKARAELSLGRYGDAKSTIDSGLRRYTWSIVLRLVGRRAYQHSGETEHAAKLLQEITELADRTPWRYTDTDDLVTLGRAALELRADARDVLVNLYDRAKRDEPNHREPYLASAQLMLEKNDAELAADILQEALKRFPDDPDVQFGIARAFAGVDEKRSAIALAKTLTLNPRHIPALRLQAGRLIDSEQYEAAEQKIAQILSVNPRQPDAWAYRAIIAHLHNDPRGEAVFRGMAQGNWRRNPEVEHLIGKKLSQKYRFAEGAAYQRRALEFAPKFLPAQVQLSQDLLRLGEEEKGWKLAREVHDADGYDVATFNLVELHDRIAQFRTLEDENFILRMEAHEAEIYGPQVLELLNRAKKTLCGKYGLELTDKVTVEIFPDENDFAVRTFGMPAVSGYLGVCFGKVITANSPASQMEHPSNWQAVLWHEFCHVVTLNLTRNKMPRWLSEGISVYEELQQNPTWGQRMTPRYRKMVLAGELTPIGELSSAFLSPASSLHLQFAYYESALVVEFLVERYGLESLKKVLGDLAVGLPINVALQRRTDPILKLEQDFEAFARQRAKELGPNADWSQPDLAAILNDDGDLVRQFLKQQPDNFALLLLLAKQHLENSEWNEAQKPLQRLIELCPSYIGADNAYLMLAQAHHELGETAKEREALARLAALDSAALSTYLRLIELASVEGDWQSVRENARRAMAVNPLIPQPHRALADAGGRLDHLDEAATAYRTMLLLDPDDPAEVLFRLATILHQRQDPQAKRYVLSALEEAPRFRAAHRLLLEIVRQNE